MDPTRVREPCRDHNTLCGTRTAQLYPLKAGFHYTTTLRFTLHGSFTYATPTPRHRSNPFAAGSQSYLLYTVLAKNEDKRLFNDLHNNYDTLEWY